MIPDGPRFCRLSAASVQMIAILYSFPFCFYCCCWTESNYEPQKMPGNPPQRMSTVPLPDAPTVPQSTPYARDEAVMVVLQAEVHAPEPTPNTGLANTVEVSVVGSNAPGRRPPIWIQQ